MNGLKALKHHLAEQVYKRPELQSIDPSLHRKPIAETFRNCN